MKLLLIALIFIIGCVTEPRTLNNCTDVIENTLADLKIQHTKNVLTDSEYVQCLNDELTLVESYQLSSRVAKENGKDYCNDECFNYEKWNIQTEINFTLGNFKGDRK